MTIQINPARVRVASGGTTNTSGQRKQAQDDDLPKVITPARADIGVIPAPESLGTMIRSAISALRQGTYWDRGTILNILV